LKITFITLGGTIAKTYSETEAALSNRSAIVEDIVKSLRLPDIEIRFDHLMHKDSLDMKDADRQRALRAVSDALHESDAIVLVQGTDTLVKTGLLLYRQLENPGVPVILTGAMTPYVIQGSDAAQNIAESLLAARLLQAGLYCVMHNRILTFPNVVKDYDRLTFLEKKQD